MYIRTKDGVYEETDILEDGSCWCLNNGGKYFRKSDIINQSESLEELCDEFVLIERNAKPIIFKTLHGAINNKIYDDEIIYGAVWTSKGLIYVAKMNDKGELCLL